MPNNELLFFADESGAKGYSDNEENTLGELGVFAGYFVPAQFIQEVRPQLEAIRSQFSTNGKLHITELSSAEQENLRDCVFEFFIQNCIRWTYEAVYVQGLHQQVQNLKSLLDEARNKRTSSIKSSFRAPKESLHTLLFEGAFAKAAAFCFDHLSRDGQITIVTDRIDDGVLKKFRAEADRFLNAGEPTEHEVTGFDPKTQKIVKGRITFELKSGSELLGEFSGLTYDIRAEDSAFTMAADVLANSVHHHLMASQPTNPGAPLNTRAIVSSHPLSSLVYGLWSGEESRYFVDVVFRHPESDA